MEQKTNLTGYPHIDRPWLKYYDLDGFQKTNTSQSIYDYMIEKSSSHPAKIAMTFYKDKITYTELYYKIDRAAQVLSSLGVKKGDRILIMMPNVPETAYLMYGASKIGAVCDFIDPRPDSIDFEISANKILSIAEEEKSKHIIALDLCYISMIKSIEYELKKIGIENLIVVPSGESMSIRSKIAYIQDMLKAHTEEIKSSKKVLERIRKRLQLIQEESKKNGNIAKMVQESLEKSPLNAYLYGRIEKDTPYTEISPIQFEKDSPAVIVHTSGTSGNRPKPIPLTNENMNEYVEQTEAAKMPVAPNDIALHMLPYFAAFGLVGVVHGGFSHSNNLIEIPAFNPNEFGLLILKNKAQIIIGPPTWFLGLIDDPNMKGKDLSFIKMATYGGDSMEPEDEVRVNEFFIKHNCKVKLTKGRTQTENIICLERWEFRCHLVYME